MRATKRILSITLALLLGLALLVPAGASGNIDIEVHKALPPMVIVFTGETLELEIDVSVTEDGVPVELEYAWFDYAWQPGDDAEPIARGPKLEIPVTVQKTADALIDEVMALSNGEFWIPYTVAVYEIIDDEAIYYCSYSSNVVIYPSSLHAISVCWEYAMNIADGNAITAAISMALSSPILLFGILFIVPFMRFLSWIYL